MDALAMPWENARAAHLLAIRRMAPVKVGNDHEEGYNTSQDGFVMHTQKVETLEPFSSHVIPIKMMEAHLGEHLNVMVQALYTQDGTLLPGLTMQNTYTELRKGSKKAVVVVQNHTAYPQTLQKKTPVARAIPIQLLPKTSEPGSLQVPDEVSPDPQTPKLMIRQRHGKLFDELDLSGLDSWAPKLVDKACQLLAKYHDVFSLDPTELGCTHLTKHAIKVTDDTPFKEHFRQIPPLIVEEVRNHLKEMLESGAIRPSQSAWCNAVMLVRKKDSGLCFCIDFQHLNAHTKKDSYLLPQIQEALESLVGASHFSCLDLKSGFWQIRMDGASGQCATFAVGGLGFFECGGMPFGLCSVLAAFQQLVWSFVGELDFICCLVCLDGLVVFLQKAGGHLHHLHVVFDCLGEYSLKLEPLGCGLFGEEVNYLAHGVSRAGIWPSSVNVGAMAGCAPLQTYTEIRAFLALVGHYRHFIKGFTQIAQPLNEHLAGEGASRKSE